MMPHMTLRPNWVMVQAADTGRQPDQWHIAADLGSEQRIA